MTDFSLPQLVAQAAPEFMDAASAKAWLEHVPLANVGAAQQSFAHRVRCNGEARFGRYTEELEQALAA